MNILRLEFDTLQDFADFLSQRRFAEHHGLSLVYGTLFAPNIGHALWDGLYPAFVTLREWDRQNETFNSVVTMAFSGDYCQNPGKNSTRCMFEDIFRTFGGGEWVPTSVFDMGKQWRRLAPVGWHRFEDAIAGTRGKGARDLNADNTLFGSQTSLNTTWWFRKRMYESHGLPTPPARTASNLGREAGAPLRGVVIENKRFTKTDRAAVDAAMAEVNRSGTFEVQYLDWKNVASTDSASPFKKQLEAIGSMDVHVSSPGTALAYAPFLADGSVHINLGSVGGDFGDEYWGEGSPHLRALYYEQRPDPPGTNLNHPGQSPELEQGKLTELLERAAKAIHGGFAVPVAPGSNLARNGQLLKAYCHLNAESCQLVLNAMNGGSEPDGWAEELVMERHIRNPEALKAWGTERLIDRCLLRK